jgi:hypothetical protein
MLVADGLAAIATDGLMTPTHGSPSCASLFTILISLHSQGSALVYTTWVYGHSVFQGDDIMAERSYDEIEHELEAALAELQDHPPQTLEALTIALVHLQTLSQERTDLVLEALLARLDRLERRLDSP